VINDENLGKALAVEKQLFDAGLISKETLARKLDLSARGYKSSKSSSGSSRKVTIPSLSELYADVLASDKTLRKLVEEATKW
jgi:hypothetical protein